MQLFQFAALAHPAVFVHQKEVGGNHQRIQTIESDHPVGTMQFVDDAGQIHVSWDCGHSLAMVFGVDHCRCVMREDRLQEILQRVQAMPFESLEKMELYITEKLSGAFPKISFQEREGQEVIADMGVAAFMKKDLGVAIQYEADSQQHIFIKKMEIQGQELERKNPFPVQKKR